MARWTIARRAVTGFNLDQSLMCRKYIYDILKIYW